MNAKHYLSDTFHYLSNVATGRAFVIDRSGKRRTAVVNPDAFDLLTSDESAWQDDHDYAPFLEKAVGAGWLSAQAPLRAPIVRTVDRNVHLKRLQYEVNLVCNLECAHCYCSSSPRASQGQSTEFVLDIVAQAAKLGVINFDVTGGEPLVRRDMVEVLQAITDHGMIPGLYTNGTLITPEKALELRDAGVRWAQVSLDARTPALHDEIRGKVGAFDRAVKGIRALKAAGVRIRVAVCLNRRNAHEVTEIVDFLRNDLCVEFGLDRVIPAGRGCSAPEPLALPNAEYYALVRPFLADGHIAAKACDAIGPEASASYIEPSCGVGASYLFLKHDGRAALCPTMTEAESADFVQADLKTMSLADAWERHPTFMAFRGMQCENATVCPTGKNCAGGCRSNAYLLHGRIDSPDEVHCNIHKNSTPTYRPMLEEYEGLREAGKLPQRKSTMHAAPMRRFLKVV